MALDSIEKQASNEDRTLAARLAYLLWAGPPQRTRLILATGHLMLFLALLVFVVADTVAYFNEELATPFTRFSRLLVLAGLGAYLAVVIRQADNRYRGVEPEQDEIILKLGYGDHPLRLVCHRVAHAIILFSLAWTYLAMNLGAFLKGAVIGSLIMAFGRIANLSLKPQWLHQTRPWPKWRSIKLGWNSIRVVAVLLVFMVLAPYFQSHDANVPSAELQTGWELKEVHTLSRGLGAVQGGLRFYMDEAKDGDGYPAALILITLKEPNGFLWDRIQEAIFDGLAEQSGDKNVNPEDELYFGTRTTAQGYETRFFIYNGTAEASAFFTKGAQMRLIGEGWYAKQERVMVIAIGFAQISTETLSTEPEPPEQLPSNYHDYWNWTVDLLPQDLKDDPRLKEIFPVPDPTNTTDTRNWLELYNMIPTVEAW